MICKTNIYFAASANNFQAWSFHSWWSLRCDCQGTDQAPGNPNNEDCGLGGHRIDRGHKKVLPQSEKLFRWILSYMKFSFPNFVQVIKSASKPSVDNAICYFLLLLSSLSSLKLYLVIDLGKNINLVKSTQYDGRSHVKSR